MLILIIVFIEKVLTEKTIKIRSGEDSIKITR